ncbi:MAG TPA: YtxH domain-containing protein, partial [Gemmatimonadaceae bacterium]
MPQPTNFSNERAFGAQTRPFADPDRHDDGADVLESEETVGRSYDESTDWGKIGSFGAGLAIGLLFGAGAALLMAPQSGEETRDLLERRARRLGHRAADRWDDLRDDFRH